MANTIFPCIDWIFTSKPSLNKESDIRKPLYTDSCHHSIGLGKVNLNVPLPIGYTREVWDYNKTPKKYPKKYERPVTGQDKHVCAYDFQMF